MLNSNDMKPVALPPGRAKLSIDEAGTDWIFDHREHDRDGGVA
jgi:hypothetical protein